MPPDSIVKDFNIFKDTLPGLRSGSVSFKIDNLCFEGMKERFHDGIVVAIARAAHALDKVMVFEGIAESMA